MKYLLTSVLVLLNCGPGTTEKNEVCTPQVKQTAQGVCIFACNGAVACPSALELVTHDTNRTFKIRVE